ncbi:MULTISPECIES: hypothetical protein [unclassified Rhodococcus (in: high G+C Gram-positive bacteria)]|uniref:hypothetical protein n=1 Tax=unclassified Rhodococcus (in: high G+C Gram-positive bacteria) TaxID=192944 RepID=UPI0029548EDE|nr:hypothetical protein [Rhodococcus sp. IEGM 1318]MDV8005163.1 hypothetical protein [Rhodococcus sp. IEGM 1318]MDZ7913919.1 hypothetical protein [Rhodococcus sp. (in: high G+C Gram-positive bacteria)]
MSGQGKSGAAQRAYEKRTARAAGRTGTAAAAGPSISPRAMLKGRVPFVASVIGLLSIGLAVTLLLTTRAAEDSYQLSDARAYNQSLVEQKAALERDFQSRNSAPELANQASALGMVPAKDPARLVVHPDGSVEVVGTPTPATAGAMPPLDAPTSVPAPTATPPRTTTPVVPGATPSVPNNTRNLAQSEQLVPVIPTTTAPATTTAVPAPPEERR